MNPMIDSLWQQALEEVKHRLQPGDIHMFRIEESRFDFFAGTDDEGRIILVLRTVGMPPYISIETEALDYYRKQTPSREWLMILRLRDITLRDVFSKLCNDIVEKSQAIVSEAAAIHLFKDRLLLWKKLFLKAGSGLLENFQIKGLMAELLALKEFLQSDPDHPVEMVAAWLGPDKFPQDFVFDDRAMEIKCISPSSTHVGISCEEQLESPIPLTLKIYEMEDCSYDSTDAINLFSLTTCIESLLSGNVEAIRIFREKLKLAGYLDNEYYKGINYRLIKINTFIVSDSFPRLIKSSLPEGISNLSYSVKLASMESHRIN